jgi:NAD(P)H-hydrate epimerase
MLKAECLMLNMARALIPHSAFSIPHFPQYNLLPMAKKTLRLTRDQVREIDHRAVDQYGIPGLVLMENAGRSAGDLAQEMLGRQKSGPVLIICGGGNNGGDGLVAARHLHNRGIDVRIGLFFDPMSFQGDSLRNWEIAQAMNLPWEPATGKLVRSVKPALVIDAIFGIGLNQDPREPFPALLEAIEQLNPQVLAIDVPTGLDSDSGEPFDHCIRATRTITMAAEKIGFTNPRAKPYLGKITIGDIGCPKELIEQVVKDLPQQA